MSPETKRLMFDRIATAVRSGEKPMPDTRKVYADFVGPARAAAASDGTLVTFEIVAAFCLNDNYDRALQEQPKC